MTNETLMSTANSTLATQLTNVPTVAGGGTYFTLPVQYDGQVKTPTEGLHCKVTVKVSDTEQKSLGGVGNRRYRKVGVVIVEVYDSVRNGTADVDRVVSEIEARLCGRTYSGLHFRTAKPQPGQRDGKWWKVNVNLPFYCDRFA